MKITLDRSDPGSISTPALMLFPYQEDSAGLDRRPELRPWAASIDPRLAAGDFQPKHLATLILFPGGPGPERLILTGLGQEKELTPARWREAAAKAVQTARDLGLSRAALLLPPATAPGLDPEAVLELAAIGAGLGQYEYLEFKTKGQAEAKKPLDGLTILAGGNPEPDRPEESIRLAEITAQAVIRARDLGNKPANQLYPESLAEITATWFKGRRFKFQILDMEEARRRGMGAFVGVAQGSHRPGRIMVVEYRGAGKGSAPLALVGKAITFDSGGISIKGAEGMQHMKTDMAAGAAVLAVVKAAQEMGLPLNLVGVVPAAENMPGGGAYRPGDVLTSMSGQTIEVISTDAEGRLVLADALTLALTYKPRLIIDLATLTAACVVALGDRCAGLLTPASDLADALTLASQSTGERIWPLPLFDDYFETLKSDVADFKNSGARSGGTTVGALFLKRFVGDTPWAHLDIAGPARAEKATPDVSAGATGFGVQLLLNYLRRQAA